MSDALTEVIYDQTSLNIDYDNEDKFLVNDSTADVKDDRVPAEESNHSGRVTEEKQNIVVYSSDPTAPQFVAKKSVWSKDPDFTGIEASESVHFYKSDDPEATEQDIETEDEDPPDEEPPQEQQTQTPTTNSEVGAEGIGDSSQAGQAPSTNGTQATPEQAATGAGDDGDWEEVPAPTDTGGQTPTDEGDGSDDGDSDKGSWENQSDTPAVVEEASGNYTELPAVDRVAAVGQLAVVVQMVGGQGALAAADSELLDSSFSAVFSDEGAADIKRAWSDDGSPESINMDVIKESGAQILFVDTPNYTQSMPTDERKKLNALISEGTVQKVVYADLSNTANLKSFVRKVGQSLKESTSIGNSGQTESIAESYVSFHDTLIRDCATASGGLAYDSLNEETRVYELGGNTGSLSTGEQLSFNGEAKFTLLLDAWDSSVRYVNSDSWDPAMSGIALSRVGFSTSPVSYYIQAGGLVNNAAARGNASNPGLYPVWQFASPPILKNSAYVSYSAGGAFDQSTAPKKRSGGTAWDPLLLTTNHNLAQGSANSGSSFGTTLFPKLIAATQEIKREIVQNSDGADELYHPFEPLSDDVRGVRGYVGADDTVYYSCIGNPGATEAVTRTVGDAITDDEVLVNPHGLFTSWTDYGSVEGVLEAAWVNDVVNDDSPTIDWLAKVTDFYTTFYRYPEIADYLSTIEAGIAG